MSYFFAYLFECKKNYLNNCVYYFFMQSFSVLLKSASFTGVDKYRNGNIHRHLLRLWKCLPFCTSWNHEKTTCKFRRLKGTTTLNDRVHIPSCQFTYIIVLETMPKNIPRHLTLYTVICMFCTQIWWGTTNMTKTSSLATVSSSMDVCMKWTALHKQFWDLINYSVHLNFAPWKQRKHVWFTKG